jgi:hypothetical protein
MEDSELKKMWDESHQQLEQARVLNLQSWVVSTKTFEYLQKYKAQSKLNGLSNFKKWMIGLGIIWSMFLVLLLVSDHFRHVYFSASVAILAAFNIYAVYAYIKQIVLINQINYESSIIDTQKTLTGLQVSTISIVRILFLQAPFYTTFYWNTQWMQTDIRFWLITFPISLVILFASLWLYRNISFKNTGKKWFRLLMGTREWTSIIDAKKYLEEIEEFKSN